MAQSRQHKKKHLEELLNRLYSERDKALPWSLEREKINNDVIRFQEEYFKTYGDYYSFKQRKI